jgi:hypothetical protein
MLNGVGVFMIGQDPLVPFTAVSFRVDQFDAGTVAGVQWLLLAVFSDSQFL